MREKLKLSFRIAYYGSKKCNRGYGSAYCGVWRSLCLAGVWSQAVRLVRLADAVKILWHLFYVFVKKLYNFRTFNAIFKNNAGVNCIAVQQKKVYSRQRLRVIYYTR
jgi:hypothetical protein